MMGRSRSHRPAELAHVSTYLLSLSLLVVLVVPAAANPLPPAMLFAHVHPWESDFCETNPITECEQIIQYSAATGDVEFDLYYLGMADELSSVDLEFFCPAGWSFFDFENCSAGITQADVYPSHCILHWSFDPPIPVDSFAPLLLGRLRVYVGGFGSLLWSHGWYEGSPISDILPMGPAMAGVGDCFCYTRCSDLSLACGMVLDPSRLELEVEVGGIVEGLLQGPARYDEHLELCPIDFVCDEPWVALSVEWPEYNWAEVTVTVDATDLSLGYHSAVVRAESECVECSEVIVFVGDPSGIPEDGPAYTTVSLGKIRSLYR
jgi:hypothetical protein